VTRSALAPERHPADVAPDLLGWTLVCRGTAAVLAEVEAYHQEEAACHAFGGRRTARTDDLFGPAGSLYIYFTYGMHWCANVVTGPEGSGEAVLFRAAIPVVGEELMRERRSVLRGVDPASWRMRDLCSGPAKLVVALDLRPQDAGIDLMTDGLTVADAVQDTSAGPRLVCDVDAARVAGIDLPLPADRLAAGPRIGISVAQELPWRFGLAGSPFLSKRF